jgi:hypothetical protein
MKKEQKRNKKRSTYETSYIDYNFMNNVVRHGLETAQRIREEAYYEERGEIFIVDCESIIEAKRIWC